MSSDVRTAFETYASRYAHVKMERSGGILQMINHGLSTGALFCLVGMFYERYHTRLLSELGGLANRLPSSPWPWFSLRSPASACGRTRP